MNIDKKKQLFPFFAYTYSQKLDPKKYGSTSTYEDWSKVLDENPTDMEKISNSAAKLSDEEWSDLEKQFDQTSEIQKAANGTKLDKLKKLKSGKSIPKKKCECGCDLITTKENGGKISSRCACGCKLKKEDGGKVKKKLPTFVNDDSYKFKEKMNAHKIKKFKD